MATTFFRHRTSMPTPASTAVGIPAGGTAGQVLTKIDGTDYNVFWATPAAAATSNRAYATFIA